MVPAPLTRLGGGDTSLRKVNLSNDEYLSFGMGQRVEVFEFELERADVDALDEERDDDPEGEM